TTLRFNTGSNEKLTTAGVTVGLSPHVALRAEGLYRNAGNYKTPHYQSSSYNSLEDLENQNSIYKNLKYFSVHDKFHRTLILSGFCLLKIAKISLNSSFF
ncbi:hypothetical protein, partial [Acinetobacter baumannii]|uniref:hypothetical protein n=1 Tax=Acinetobacter baumannii TaxID=470 RepID=UPI00208F2537